LNIIQAIWRWARTRSMAQHLGNHGMYAKRHFPLIVSQTVWLKDTTHESFSVTIRLERFIVQEITQRTF